MKFRSIVTRSLIATGLLLGAVSTASAIPVTFQVDMNSQTTALTTNVYVRGSWNGWGTTDVLTNNGAGIFSGTFNISDSPGSVQACKFFYYPDPPPGETWENDPNRQFVLAAGSQTLPLTSWDVKDWPLPDNNVTFQVDMSAQIQLGKFTNGVPGSFVAVSGAFNGWNQSIDFTNDANAIGLASNIYSQTLIVAGFPGSSPGEYKFRAPIAGGTYESINNRPSFQIAGGDQTLPLVFWDNASTCDLLQHDTTVTFRLHITNGTPDRDLVPFNKASDLLYINGAFLGWWAWFDGISGGQGPANQLTNNPIGSDFYEQTFVISEGSPLSTKFKFSINGYDNEAGFATDHVKFVRTTGSSYNMPVAEFGTNFLATLVEQSFGDLSLAPAVGGVIPVSWLGRQCVTLQTKPAVSGGTWTDLPGTDGNSSTNWPNSTGESQFFRLQKRNNL